MTTVRQGDFTMRKRHVIPFLLLLLAAAIAAFGQQPLATVTSTDGSSLCLATGGTTGAWGP